MKHSFIHTLVFLFLAGGILLSGCGGGGGSATVSIPPGIASALAWDAPQTYEDHTPLDPVRDLDYYEFYVRNDPNFTDNDLPLAQVAAAEDILNPDGTYRKSPTSLFNLANLSPFLNPGAQYYICIRAVGIDGLKSDFSQPITWDYTS